MIGSLRFEDIDRVDGIKMEDREIVERRRSRQQRIARAKSRGRQSQGGGNFFATPSAAIVSMFVALGSIIAFWRGVPDWALIAMGMGAVIILGGTTLLLRSKKKQ